MMLPCTVLYHLCVFIVGADRVFPGWAQLVSLLPGVTGIYLRRAFYRACAKHAGTDCWIGFGTVCSHAGIDIGDRAYIGVGCMLGDVTLGEDVLIGSHVSIINGNRQHGIDRLDIPVREQQGIYPHVTIGRDTWIGDRAIVMANLGAHCVVGAGSVVTKPVADYEIVVGNPARTIGSRNPATEASADMNPLSPKAI